MARTVEGVETRSSKLVADAVFLLNTLQLVGEMPPSFSGNSPPLPRRRRRFIVPKTHSLERGRRIFAGNSRFPAGKPGNIGSIPRPLPDGRLFLDTLDKIAPRCRRAVTATVFRFHGRQRGVELPCRFAVS